MPCPVRALPRHGQVEDHATRAVGEHHHAVRQQQRLVDVVRHQHDRTPVTCEVEAENTAAGTLYTALGFQPAERYVYRER